MKKNIAIIILLSILTTTVIFSQQNSKFSNFLESQINAKGLDKTYTVWIFLKDKGTHIENKLAKSKQSLTLASIKRRKKIFKNENYVTFYDIPVEQSYINQIKPFLTKLRHQSSWLNAISAKINGDQLSQIAKFDFVKRIDIVRKRTYDKPELDENTTKNSGIKGETYTLDYGSSLTQLEQINVPFVHDLGYTGNGVIICVLDAGFNNLEHQAFTTMNILDSYDFVNDDANVDDEGDMGTGNHGTMTLSTIGGFYEGELIGPAYGASYLLAKTENTDSETQVEEDNWVAGAQWAEALGAEITSTSLGYIDFDDGTGYDASELDGNTATITIAADIMASLGVLVVNSAGNSGSGTTTIGAPADGNEVLAVGAVNSSGMRTSFSSVGPTSDGRIKPEVMAMGSGVVVANTSGNTYTTASGTSFSCPLTAGAAALLWEMVPTASNMEIFEALKMTADNASSPNNEYGWGIIDIYAAYVYLALPQISTIPLSDTEEVTGPYTVTAKVTSNYDLVADSPKLYYRMDEGAWNSLTMTTTDEVVYTADIPGTGTFTIFDYYITAENINAMVTAPENAPTAFYTFHIIEDTEAPQIVHKTIAEYYKNLWYQASVNATLTDNLGIDLATSYVEWQLNGTTQSNISFTHISENEYAARFPLTEVNLGDVIAYRLVVKDVSNAQNSVVFPATGYQSFSITDRISFEQNQFSHNWLFSGHDNWFVTDAETQDGIYSAQTGSISHYQNSTLELNFTTDVSGDISFYKKVSSEEDYDYLYFYINDVEQDKWSGEDDWSLETFHVTAGTYQLKWRYFKDIFVSSGSDAAWIDNITLPQFVSAAIVEEKKGVLKLFPNPAKSIIFFAKDNISHEIININLYTNTGSLMHSYKNHNINKPIDISELNSGLYLVKVFIDNKTYYTKLLKK
jgi:hypothetical protein